MSALEIMGKEVLNLVKVSDKVNNVVLGGLSGILKSVSSDINLRKALNTKQNKDIADMLREIKTIKSLDDVLGENVNEVTSLLKDKRRDHHSKSFLKELEKGVKNLLFISTDLNQMLLNSSSNLLSNVDNSSKLSNILDKKNISLADLADDIKVIKKLDNMTGKLIDKTDNIIPDGRSGRRSGKKKSSRRRSGKKKSSRRRSSGGRRRRRSSGGRRRRSSSRRRSHHHHHHHHK